MVYDKEASQSLLKKIMQIKDRKKLMKNMSRPKLNRNFF